MNVKKTLISLVSAFLIVMVFVSVNGAKKENSKMLTAYAISMGDAERERGQYIYDYLQENTEWNHAAICGIIAHLYQESRFLPNVVNNYSGAYGIAQWLGTRKNSLLTLNGYDTTDVQLEYLVNELTYGNDFRYSRNAILNASDDPQGAYDTAFNLRLNFGWGYFGTTYAAQAHLDDCANIASNARDYFYYEFAPQETIIPAEPETSEYLKGDINGDEKIDASDASQILQIYGLLSTSGEPTESAEQQTAADVNSDGKIDASDASYVLGYYGHLSTGGGMTIDEFMLT